MSFPRTSSPVPEEERITVSSSCECYSRYHKFVINLHSSPNWRKIRIRGTRREFKEIISGHLIPNNPNLERFDAFVNGLIARFEQAELKNTNSFEGVTQF
ncbi:hypothetical protein TcasGA2_TC013334 [Tribolium castaneum]|uniref:Uncharacterized protein n=1 Tax=Tribolium castaneum TaxID=7070 RepID=D6WM68_TRICA|nr:hypothetical protein TcasGA2_TC013334 [Tribolium castaneum]